MDDPKKVADDQIVSPQVVQQSVAGQQVADDTHQVQVIEPEEIAQPSSPQMPVAVGSMHKEAGPTIVVEQPLSEVLMPSEQSPEIPAEVKEAGVEVSPNPQVPDLTIHDKKAGLDHSPVIVPVPSVPSSTIQLPITEEKAVETLKHKDTSKGITWLAEIVLRHVKMMHSKMKGEH